MSMFSNTEMIAAAYFIIGGSKQNEGCIITRSRSKVDDKLT